MKDNGKGNYWRDIAYSDSRFGEIRKPVLEGLPLYVEPRYEVRKF